MDRKDVEVLVAVQDTGMRAQVAAILEEAGIGHVNLETSDLRQRSLKENNFVILETGHDVGLLNQTVNQLYGASKHARGRLIAIVSNETALRNPRLSFWLVDGGSALFALLVPERGDLKYIPNIINKVIADSAVRDAQSAPATEADEDRNWEALITGEP